MELLIRPATLRDVPSIARAHVECWEAAFRGLIPDEKIAARTLEVRSGQWAAALADPSRFVLVACDAKGDVLGFASARVLDGSTEAFQSYLQTLYVRPRSWRRGVGRRLLQAVCVRLHSLGVRDLALRTMRLGHARNFYERLGARLVPEGLARDAGDYDDVVYAFDDISLIATCGDRHPTSHERRSGQPWDASYQDGPAPWDIGGPQPVIARLAAEGAFAGAVLDAGCGTGENALLVAALGLPVLGVDVADTALATARAKARDHGIEAEFASVDALNLERLGRTFETVLDCGLFHTFDGDERRRYVAGLASVMKHGGTLFVLCFSNEGSDVGPHPVSREELTAAFDPGGGWRIAAIVPERVQTRFGGAPAWLATIKRT
jgi:SAM-dependent methyltransferase/GNAT superfamily N-acetyltransferase